METEIQVEVHSQLGEWRSLWHKWTYQQQHAAKHVQGGASHNPTGSWSRAIFDRENAARLRYCTSSYVYVHVQRYADRGTV